MNELNELESEVRQQNQQVYLCAYRFYEDRESAHLDLSDLGLTQIPRALSHMQWVETLDLRGNNLSSDELAKIPPTINYLSGSMAPEPTEGERMSGAAILAIIVFVCAFGLCGQMELGVMKWAIAIFCSLLSYATIAISGIIPLVVGVPMALIIGEILPGAWAHGDLVQFPGVSLLSVVAAGYAARCLRS